jgi:hypothetical protein
VDSRIVAKVILYPDSRLHLCWTSPPEATKKHRFAMRRRRVQGHSYTLHSEVVEEVFSHASRFENLHLEGNTKDVFRILTSLEDSIPLVSLSLVAWDGRRYLPLEREGEENQESTSFILPENFLGSRAPQLRRLECCQSLHVTFPSWVLGTISEFSVPAFIAPNVYLPLFARCLNLRY